MPVDPVMGRILALPRVEHHGGPEIDARYRRHNAAPPLRDVQRSCVAALEWAAATQPGPWGPYGSLVLVGCGHGKSLVTYLAPCVLGSQRPVLFVPAALMRQTERAYTDWSAHYRFGAVPSTLTYEGLSSSNGRGYLARTQPDLIIADEAHYLGNADSGRWRRLARYLVANPQCRFVALSGTLLRSSLLQIAHLSHAALRDRSPLPVGHTLQWWASCTDVGGEPAPEMVAYLAPLARWAGEGTDKGGLRRALGARLGSACGVVRSHGISADVALTLHAFHSERTPPVSVTLATRSLCDRWELPDGSVLVDALEVERARRTIPYGFFHRAVPPVHPAWIAARKAWSRVVRALLDSGRADTPGTAADWVRQHGGRTRAVLDTWLEADRIIAPQREVVWLSPEAQDWVVGTVADQLHIAREPTVVWYRSRAVGALLAARLGLPQHGPGSPAPTGGHAVVSATVHGVGWNGQAYARALVVEPSLSGAQWEQLLARQHRPGQLRDCAVSVWINGEIGREHIARAIAGASYIEAATADRQRLLYADRTGNWTAPTPQ